IGRFAHPCLSSMQNKKEHARESDRDHVALPYNCHNVRIIAASQFNPHERETPMSKSYSLPTEPEGVIPSLIERFNSGNVSAMETWQEAAGLVADDGRAVADPTEIAAALERDLSLGLPLEAKARHVFVNGDIAQIVVDWSIDGTGPDGKHVHVEGTA